MNKNEQYQKKFLHFPMKNRTENIETVKRKLKKNKIYCSAESWFARPEYPLRGRGIRVVS